MPRQIKLASGSEKLTGSRCAVCRGMLNFCGLSRCPIIQKIQSSLKVKGLVNSDIVFGASPPSVFVGEWSYPKVSVGPLVPPIIDTDTSILDDPSRWLGKTIDQIIDFRMSLIRSHTNIRVTQAARPTKHLEVTQELAMASMPVDTEIKLTKVPIQKIVFSQWTPPMGPTAPLREVKLTENPKVNPKIDYVTSDRDTLATTAVLELYRAGISPYQLTRLLSIGLLGREQDRKLVPTKWSITAIDDMVSRRIHRQVINYPEINEFRVFGEHAVGNNIWILLLPATWMFEVLECWLPGTIFLPDNYQTTIASDYELSKGRRTYANIIGGAYYAARLPVLEYLNKERKQAGAIIFFEVHPDWSVPLGVWRVREICKGALDKPSVKFGSLEEALNELAKRLRVPIQGWVNDSKILAYYKKQTTLPLFTTAKQQNNAVYI